MQHRAEVDAPRAADGAGGPEHRQLADTGGQLLRRRAAAAPSCTALATQQPRMMGGDGERLGHLTEPALGNPVHDAASAGRPASGLPEQCGLSVSYPLDEAARRCVTGARRPNPLIVRLDGLSTLVITCRYHWNGHGTSPTAPAVVHERPGGETMRAIVLEKFGGLDSLVYRMPDHAQGRPGLIEVKAFGLNHAEMHMRRASGPRPPKSAASSASASSSPAPAASSPSGPRWRR